jgi:molybdopterin-guanine dinucleotide biosynthesis protein B
MRVIGLAGWSGAGKTTLLQKLIPELRQRGLTVSTLKHAHHAFEPDQPGKDSFLHRQAGATEVLVSSSRRWALMHELRGDEEPGLAFLLSRLCSVDLVVVEGFKSFVHPKIEVYRAANRKPLLARAIPNVVLIASDLDLPDAPVAVVDLDDVSTIADGVLRLAQPLDDVVAELESASAGERVRASGRLL